jgi:copper chaperone NosL
MVKFLLTGMMAAVLACTCATNQCWAQTDRENPPSCRLCGMDRHAYSHSRMLLQYSDGSTTGTCSIHCAAMELVLNSDKIVTAIRTADYNTKKLIAAKSASWVIGGSRPGVMTIRAKWAFEQRSEAERFTKRYGGQIATYDDALKASFQDMYQDVKVIRQRRERQAATLQDIQDHPECRYCGMKRESFAFSRMLIRYNNGPAVGTCSIHCASIDIALNTDRMPEAILVGDYHTKRLIDAEKAVWVIGGTKPGIMTIRGKWAFEQRKDADAFRGEQGGRIASFDEAMKATFEDIHEMLR